MNVLVVGLEVLDRRSVALAAPADNIEEPDAFRGVDGSSVYSAAGADLYTSQRILDAERRLVIVAGRRDGRAVRVGVDLAFLEMAANRTTLDAVQASSVRQMWISGARLQHPGFAEVCTPNWWSPHHSCART